MFKAVGVGGQILDFFLKKKSTQMYSFNTSEMLLQLCQNQSENRLKCQNINIQFPDILCAIRN